MVPQQPLHGQTARVAVQYVRKLDHFPSASSVILQRRKLYLTGDDSRYMLVLNKDYRPIDSTLLFNQQENRVSRKTKADLESAVVAGGSIFLFGSGSSPQREKVYEIPLRRNKDGNFSGKEFRRFFDRVRAWGHPVNIEGAAIVKGKLILAHRRLKDGAANTLFLTDCSILKNDSGSLISRIPVEVPDSIGNFPGISDLCYVRSRDRMFLTLSSEATTSATHDGAIGDSYIAWIDNISKRFNSQVIRLDGIVNLSASDKRLAGEKIEGIVVMAQSADTFLLHLVSDNDDGTSKIFRVQLNF